MVMATYQYECNTTLLFLGFSRQEYWNTGILEVILQARILEWVAFPFSSGSSNPGIERGSPALQANSLLTELPGKALFFFFHEEGKISVLVCIFSDSQSVKCILMKLSCIMIK